MYTCRSDQTARGLDSLDHQTSQYPSNWRSKHLQVPPGGSRYDGMASELARYRKLRILRSRLNRSRLRATAGTDAVTYYLRTPVGTDALIQVLKSKYYLLNYPRSWLALGLFCCPSTGFVHSNDRRHQRVKHHAHTGDGARSKGPAGTV